MYLINHVEGNYESSFGVIWASVLHLVHVELSFPTEDDLVQFTLQPHGVRKFQAERIETGTDLALLEVLRTELFLMASVQEVTHRQVFHLLQSIKLGRFGD